MKIITLPVGLVLCAFNAQAQADDLGGWLLSGAPTVIPNPNAFQ